MSASIAMPETWSSADRLLDSPRGWKAKTKIGHNTWLVRGDASIDVVYHETAIISLTIDGAVLANGGWFTRTTADRIRKFLQARGMRLVTRKGAWSVVDGAGVEHAWRNGMRVSGSEVVA